MNHKTLVIALALAAPALFVIGCGGMNETRNLAEQPAEILPVDTMQQPSQPADPGNGVTDVSDEQPVEDVAAAVFAEVQAETSSLPVQPPRDQSPQEQSPRDQAEPSIPQPDTLAFYFATNDSKVQQADFEKLIAHAKYLMQHPDMSLRISGHTDQSGSADYNRWLARQRAEAVARVLIEYGVQPSQVHVESLGEDNPVAGLEHAIADRRVELEYAGETRLSEASNF